MEKSDAIRHAVRQVPAPELPAGFTPRLMERMRREAARRERRETWLLTAGGVGCPDFALPRPELPHIGLPHIELPRLALPEEDKSLVAMCVCIALAFLVLLLADLMIHRHIASSRN